MRALQASAAALLLLVAAAPRIAAQEVTTELYGEFRYSYNHADAGDSTHWAAANNASRLGVRSEATLGSVAVFADLQTGVTIDGEGGGAGFSQRYYLAGVRGTFGSLTIGRHSPAYKAAGARLDPFYDTSTLSASGAVPEAGLFAGATFGLSGLTNGWADRAIAYTSPSIHGFSVNAAAYLDRHADHDAAYGFTYRGGGFEAGAQFHDTGSGDGWVPSTGVDDAVRVHLSYARPQAWSVGASFERIDAAGEMQDFVYAAGTAHVAPRLMLAGAVGRVESGPLQAVTGTGWHAGAFYTLLPQAGLHALLSHVDVDGGPSRRNLAVGLTYRFSIAR